MFLTFDKFERFVLRNTEKIYGNTGMIDNRLVNYLIHKSCSTSDTRRDTVKLYKHHVI